jgi:hypothetical protein
MNCEFAQSKDQAKNGPAPPIKPTTIRISRHHQALPLPGNPDYLIGWEK